MCGTRPTLIIIHALASWNTPMKTQFASKSEYFPRYNKIQESNSLTFRRIKP
jgi:hypothetical protein